MQQQTIGLKMLQHFSKQELFLELQMASYKLVLKPDAFWVLLTIERIGQCISFGQIGT